MKCMEKILVRNPRKEWLLARSRRRNEGDFKVDLREIWWEVV